MREIEGFRGFVSLESDESIWPVPRGSAIWRNFAFAGTMGSGRRHDAHVDAPFNDRFFGGVDETEVSICFFCALEDTAGR